RSDGTWRAPGRCVSCRRAVAAGLRLLRQAQRARLERGAHGKGLVGIDGTPRLSVIYFARRRLGCLRGNRNGATETDRLARDSSQLSAGHSQPDSEIAFAE